MLDAKTLTAIAKQVQRQFPEVVGCKPNVRVQHPPQAKNTSPTQVHNPPLYLVTFRGTAVSSEGKSIPRLVRVVVNADGKIIKITTSR
jgi:predicted lipoprotein